MTEEETRLLQDVTKDLPIVTFCEIYPQIEAEILIEDLISTMEENDFYTDGLEDLTQEHIDTFLDLIKRRELVMTIGQASDYDLMISEKCKYVTSTILEGDVINIFSAAPLRLDID